MSPPEPSRLLSGLDANNPLAARADLLGEFRLAEAEPLAAISNDRAKIGGGTNRHRDTLSTFDDIIPMSAFDDILSRNVMTMFRRMADVNFETTI
jgi:hypothetical protein